MVKKMGHELIRLCDGIERHGLVDYQYGVWEERITAGMVLQPPWKRFFGSTNMGVQFSKTFSIYTKPRKKIEKVKTSNGNCKILEYFLYNDTELGRDVGVRVVIMLASAT
jgi:hypothetical protein